MQFRAEQYYRVSLQRMNQARWLFAQGESFALALYCGGLAVESLLRAFRWTEDDSFEGRHDLNELLKASRLPRINDESMRRKRVSEEEVRRTNREIRVAMNDVVTRWHNNLRFASEDTAVAFLKQSGKAQGIKGDPLKRNAAVLIEAAQTLVNRGVTLWTSDRR